jgi:hypothetical protein
MASSTREQTTVYDSSFGGWAQYPLSVTDNGNIIMYRYGTFIDPVDAIAMGTALIQAGTLAQERRKHRPKPQLKSA